MNTYRVTLWINGLLISSGLYRTTDAFAARSMAKWTMRLSGDASDGFKWEVSLA